ncbi:hypothetical protein DSM43518_03204 [Mycobacterium marinum]|uniref:hypothetical protein n=1 Tax=Mycobacterium marinum TaxID=1781 RepID=UPI000CD90BEF|nr:hypothetical protein [Mycobacterium marinum]RFZ08018.1 hypothetical protein DSM43518_03204 [Mycobacterium marinum]WOR07509.1 hypothetical protein QDR78_27335 [Mycobacterium marinum]
MTKRVAGGVCVVVAAELLALLLPDRRFALGISGAVAAAVLFGVRGFLEPETEPQPTRSDAEDAGEMLRRWQSQTEILIRWSESTRSNWDRHLRPMLARRFEMATGQRRAKDPTTFDATGRMLFGKELWGWVDQENIAPCRGREPAPGRAALNEILQRLEQV